MKTPINVLPLKRRFRKQSIKSLKTNDKINYASILDKQINIPIINNSNNVHSSSILLVNTATVPMFINSDYVHTNQNTDVQ